MSFLLYLIAENNTYSIVACISTLYEPTFIAMPNWYYCIVHGSLFSGYVATLGYD